ncbi:hypothetical protein [Falsibacillus pallidus]|uniref:Uncharacterized protein n=1 Tax=Falsibacillus pallidus TaxID=493781 RepID=A0A370G4N7_9BACI|nr:hypothetical protein [Falsibacillus pallidus]RDI37544.1 hypothetical protein DFR59_12141 [Falsibacillus pallidus]
MRTPRFRKEKTAKLVILIGKIFTMMIITAMTYPLIYFLSEIPMTQETWLLYVGGTAIGVLSGKVRLSGGVNRKMTRWVIFLSCLTIMLVVNILMNIEDNALITVIGLLVGIPTYASLKYHFSDLEKEIKNYYDNKEYDDKGYKRFRV